MLQEENINRNFLLLSKDTEKLQADEVKQGLRFYIANMNTVPFLTSLTVDSGKIICSICNKQDNTKTAKIRKNNRNSI